MKILVGGKTAKDLRNEYGISRSTSYRAVLRGYFCPRYHTAKMAVGDMQTFPVVNAYRVASAVFYCYFGGRNLWQWQEDMQQAAILRMLELSGISVNGHYLWAIAHNAMRAYIRKNRLVKNREFQSF